MLGKIFLLLCLIVNSVLLGQNEINFQNKALLKVLQKNGINNFSQLTEISISESMKQQYRLQGKFFEINSDVSQYRYIYTGRVNSCRAGGCSISVETPKGAESEYFDYFILFDKEKKVQLVKIFNYQATHGHEITAKGWLKQFIGHDGSEPLKVDKNIDAISGATISVHAITYDIEIKTSILNNGLALP